MKEALELGVSGLDTYLHAYHPISQRGDRLLMPRTSLIIGSTINYIFATESVDKEKSLTAISDVLPLLVACNDYRDIGIPAKFKLKGRYSQSQFYPLFILEKNLRLWMENQQNTLQGKYPDNGEIQELSEIVIQESILLGETGLSLHPEEYIEFLEIDMATMEVACYAFCFSNELKDESFDYFHQVNSYAELKNKYRCFYDQESNVSNRLKRVKGLHAMAMVTKILDDFLGACEEVPGLPSFRSYALWKCNNENVGIGQTRDELVDYYHNRAELFDFDKLTSIMISVAFSQMLKRSASLRRDNTPIIPLDNLQTLLNRAGQGKYSGYVREQLSGSGILNELFR